MQTAIHAVPKKWNECGGPNYRSSSSSMIPYYLDFLANSTLKMLIYSGDQDTVIPFMGTEQWVIDLNQTNLNFWGPWYSDWSGTNQVAGYWINFDKIWYCTVKGAGHMVPWFQPGPAFSKRILFFDSFPTNSTSLLFSHVCQFSYFFWFKLSSERKIKNKLLFLLKKHTFSVHSV